MKDHNKLWARHSFPETKETQQLNTMWNPELNFRTTTKKGISEKWMRSEYSL